MDDYGRSANHTVWPHAHGNRSWGGKVIGASKGEEKIAVEIKSFLGVSWVSEFHMAVGQYVNYVAALRKFESDRLLFLAVSVKAYEEFFSEEVVKQIVEENEIKMLVFDVNTETVKSWKK